MESRLTKSVDNPSPMVTVVVPNYNHARFLGRRLESILEQTFRDFELIILDDASPDNSVEIIRDFALRFPARVIENTQNSGSPFRQWNRGVREARGKYVWIAESDDDADPRLLETLVGVLDENPNVVLAYCCSTRIDDEGRVLDYPLPNPKDAKFKRWGTGFINSGIAECEEHLLWVNTIPNASGVLFRRSTYLDAGGAEEGMRYTGDWITWCRLAVRGDVAYVPEELNRFRWHGNSVRTTITKSQCAEENYRVRLLISKLITGSSAVSSELARTANEAAFCYLQIRNWPKTREFLQSALRHKMQMETIRLLALSVQVLLLTRAPVIYGAIKKIHRLVLRANL